MTIFREARVRGIVGWGIFKTWYTVEDLLKSGWLDLQPFITHCMSLNQIDDGMKLVGSGESGKIYRTLDFAFYASLTYPLRTVVERVGNHNTSRFTPDPTYGEQYQAQARDRICHAPDAANPAATGGRRGLGSSS